MPSFKVLHALAAASKRNLRAMLDKAEAEGRDLNVAENAAYDEELKALTDIKKSIERRQDMLEWERAQGISAPLQPHSAKRGPIKRAAGVPIETLRKMLDSPG